MRNIKATTADRVLSVFLVIAMFIGAFPLLNSSALEDEEDYTITDEKKDSISFDCIKFDKDSALRVDEDKLTYVYSGDTTVKISANIDSLDGEEDTTNYIRLRFEDSGGDYYPDSENVSEITLDESKIITGIQVYAQLDGETGMYWHDVDIREKKLNILFDNTAPNVDFNMSEDVNGYYTDNFQVDITVEDTGSEDYTGIDSISYFIEWIDENGHTQKTNKSSVEIDSSKINKQISTTIKVLADGYNSDEVKLIVTVKDKAGNEKSYEQGLKIITETPTVDISIDGNLAKGAKEGYYNSDRTASIAIKDWAFDEGSATKAIKIYKNGEEVEFTPITWISNGKNYHTANIVFTEEAKYEWLFDTAAYENTAKLKIDLNEDSVSVKGDSVYNFVIDKTAPKGKITLGGSDIVIELLENVFNDTVFEIWQNTIFTIGIEADDALSSVYQIEYYKADSNMVISMEELDTIYENKKFSEYNVKSGIIVGGNTDDKNEKFTIYARLTDYAGNYAYIGSNGIIYDNTISAITKLEAVTKPNKNGIYNTDVEVRIEVKDVDKDSVHSGISSVDYKVIVDGDDKNPTQNGNLYKFETENPTYNDLADEWKGSLTIDSIKNSSDNVSVIITVIDNAGNKYEETLSGLKINTDKVAAEVSFNDKPNIVGGQGYINKGRTATITIMDRVSSFNPENFVEGISIKATDKNGKAVDDAYKIGKWKCSEVESHEDCKSRKHTLEIDFFKDANYDLTFLYTNKAGNPLEDITVDEDESPYKFTIDTEAPAGKISIQKNSWDYLLKLLSFGRYSNSKVNVSVEAQDNISPFKVEYYKTTTETKALSKEALDKKSFVLFENIEIEEDEKFVFYIKLTDYAGNYSYICSDGYVVDKVKSTITLTADKPNASGIYNKDVNVKVKVEDTIPYSGIKSIDYVVIKDNDEKHPTQSGNLYKYKIANPSYEELKALWEGNIVVDSKLNNSSNVKVIVSATDNAGNKNSSEIKIDIDIYAPEITLTYNNNKDNGGNGYFDAKRTATLVIKERTNHFDAKDATNGISISAVDRKGTKVENSYSISKWTTKEGNTPDESTHTLTINYNSDANYKFKISYKDKGGNENAEINTGKSVAPFNFTVDTTAPTGTIKAVTGEGKSYEWTELVKSLTFGIWSKKNIKISRTAVDLTSPIDSIMYVKYEDSSRHTKKELDKVTDWKKFNSLMIKDDEQFTVYMKITDKAGNYTYISTDGLIVDSNAPIEELIEPIITISPQQPVNGIYNRDVKVDIKVTDPIVGDAYSGLSTISYKVFNLGKETQSGTLFMFDEENPVQKKLVQTYSTQIEVDCDKNNSNDVVIQVTASDNSKNTSKQSASIKIDTTNPVINVSYDNNSADSNGYFKANRMATIAITERNFNPDDVIIKITNTENVIPDVSGWTKTSGSGNKDNDVWRATVHYESDGDYTFDVSYKDLAGNSAGLAQYGNSIYPTKFTIDKVLPQLTVTYDNNSVVNGKYYKADRTATIVVSEHNFDPARVNITLEATDDERSIAAPTVSQWTTNGDTHTATITYNKDARYTFDIEMTDMAGNASAGFDSQVFFVDKTAPMLEITGVKDESANNGEVVPVISYSDTNFDADNVKITLVGAKRKDVKLDGSYAGQHNGQIFSFKNFEEKQENDDIYTLEVTLKDMAGNETSKSIMFSVNRFGSTYNVSDSTDKLNGTYVNTTGSLLITEVNANSLKDIVVTVFKNNETIILKEGDDFSLNIEGGNGKWYKYEYTIFEKNFADDGVYRVTIQSNDEAGNVAKTDQDTKNLEISFGVDNTLPVINVKNLDSGVTYAVEKMTVNMNVKDNLKLEKVVVILDDKEYRVWDKTDLEQIVVAGGDFSFEISGDSTSAHELAVYAVDAAGNGMIIDGEDYPENVVEIGHFYVTTNVWVRYFNNKPLFFGSIFGILALIGFIVFIVVRRRRKNVGY